MNHFSAKLQTGNEHHFFAFVQDAAKDFFRFAQFASCAKRRDNRANLLLWYANADNALAVVGGHSDYAEPRCGLGLALLKLAKPAEAADAFRAIWDGDEVELEYKITNSDRTVGAALGGAIKLKDGLKVSFDLAAVPEEP